MYYHWGIRFLVHTPMKKIFYFDLEETIIESWNDPVLCNVSVVKDFIKDNGITEIHIFSGAIWNGKDKNHFELTMKSWLERVFGVEIKSFPSMEEVRRVTQWKSVLFEDVQEMVNLIGKKRMFEDWCIQTHSRGSHCVLLDDMFGNTILINRDLDITVETVDVTKL